MIFLPLSLLVYVAICLITGWLLRASVAGFWGIVVLCFLLTPAIVLIASLLLTPEPRHPPQRAKP